MSNSKIKNFLSDCKTMTIRCIKLSLRNPQMIVISLMLPVLLLVLFVYIFGGSMNTEALGASYLNYLVAGIIIMAIGQSASSTSVVICSDVHKGLLDRFLSLPVSKASFLVGHTISALIRNTISVLIMFGVAFAMGFNPQANFVQWLAVAGILILFMLIMTLMCIFFGLLAKEPESANMAQPLTQILVFLSSGFVLTENMPDGLSHFSNYQPITPIIETVRSLFFTGTLGDRFLEAILWLVGLLIVFYVLSFFTFRRRVVRK
ncbi:MAG: ABC transporter permease [Firmicutes bacterium]|nr:ABC transporter permease [Bacillota bacterium]